MKNAKLSCAILICTSIFMSACSEKPQENMNSEKTPILPEKSDNIQSFGDMDSENVQINMSIEDLYERFSSEIIGTVQNGSDTIEIERIYECHSFENDAAAQFYFDKPRLIGSGDAIARINSVFDNEALGFFYGSEFSLHHKDGYYDTFNIYVPALPNFESGISMRCSAQIEIIYWDDSILSILESCYWQTTGHEYISRYCVNFDPTTGEILTINNFVGEDLHEFKKLVEDTLYAGIEEETEENKHYIDRWSEQWVSSAIEHQANFEFSDYNYYYDGANIHLIVHAPQFYAFDRIVKLSGIY